MNKGIKRQMEALIGQLHSLGGQPILPHKLISILCSKLDGFNKVFPIKTLSIFTPSELGKLIAGEDTFPVTWTYNDLLNYFEPVAGYTRQSPGYLLLLNVLTTFNGLERRAFVKFITGCPNLPPGGFKNLYPVLKVSLNSGLADITQKTVEGTLKHRLIIVFFHPSPGSEEGRNGFRPLSKCEHLHALPEATRVRDCRTTEGESAGSH